MVAKVQLDRNVVVDPLGAMHRRRRQALDDAFAPGPQPGRDRSVLEREDRPFGYIHVGQHPAVERPEFVAGEHPAREGLAPDEDSLHEPQSVTFEGVVA